MSSNSSLRLASTSPGLATTQAYRPRSAHALLAAFDPDQPSARVSTSIRAIVTEKRDSVIVWAPESDRVELRLEDDSEHSRTIECRRDTGDAGDPARCSAADARPSHPITHATLTVYFGLNGSR
jgi:hypothetical protein